MSTLFMSAVATLVFCAPGYPGAPGDAQPYVDQFAKAAATSAGWSEGSLAAAYDPTEQGGLKVLNSADAVLTFVPYAFYVQFGAQLHLAPIAQADVVDVGTQERWTLIGKAGTPSDAAALAGYTIVSVAGYAPEFVRHQALKGVALPADIKIEASGQVLSALRRVISTDKVLALLDQTQAAALPTLPFAAQLKTLAQSAPLPVAVVAVVNQRVPAARAKSFQAALLKLSSMPADADALAQLHLKGFILPQLPAAAGSPAMTTATSVSTP
jgi:hypothetical protein